MPGAGAFVAADKSCRKINGARAEKAAGVSDNSL
jgi:hypothetical protein